MWLSLWMSLRPGCTSLHRAVSGHREWSYWLEIMLANSCTTKFPRWTPSWHLNGADMGGYAIQITSGWCTTSISQWMCMVWVEILTMCQLPQCWFRCLVPKSPVETTATSSVELHMGVLGMSSGPSLWLVNSYHGSSAIIPAGTIDKTQSEVLSGK